MRPCGRQSAGADGVLAVRVPRECDNFVPAATAVDHHRPGDPGYGRPSEEFLSASSLGQTIKIIATTHGLPDGWGAWVAVLNAWVLGGEKVGEFLYGNWEGWTLPVAGKDYDRNPIAVRYIMDAAPAPVVLIAAADHCLAAAYRGECPGVSPAALMRWRAASRAAFQRRSVEAVLADVEKARHQLKNAPGVTLLACLGICDTGGACEACDTDRVMCAPRVITAQDMRGQSLHELPEAAAREGMAFLATVSEKDGREKVVLQAASSEQVRAFLEHWAPAQGLTDIYGDPSRGFAGGYVRKQ